jgi:hypothetical protein
LISQSRGLGDVYKRQHHGLLERLLHQLFAEFNLEQTIQDLRFQLLEVNQRL